MKTKEELLYNLRMFTSIGWDIPDEWFRYIVIDCKPINWWGWLTKDGEVYKCNSFKQVSSVVHM